MHNDLMSMIHIMLVTLFGFTYTFLSMAATHMKNTFVPKMSLFLFTVNGQIKVCTGFMCYVFIILYLYRMDLGKIDLGNLGSYTFLLQFLGVEAPLQMACHLVEDFAWPYVTVIVAFQRFMLSYFCFGLGFHKRNRILHQLTMPHHVSILIRRTANTG